MFSVDKNLFLDTGQNEIERYKGEHVESVCSQHRVCGGPGWHGKDITSMQRRDFLKRSVALAAAAELGATKAHGFVLAHNWDKYDFGSGPTVADRLNQGPFPQYAPEALIPTDDVVIFATSKR